MLTAANCYLLWSFTWLNFVTALGHFSYRGRNLRFYTATGEPFGFSIPEMFFGFSIALVIFAVSAVLGGTWRTPRLWKRLLAVTIFAAITLGASILNLHLRHYCYDRALESREHWQLNYQRNLSQDYDPYDPFGTERKSSLEWALRSYTDLDFQIKTYEGRYGLPNGKTSAPVGRTNHPPNGR